MGDYSDVIMRGLSSIGDAVVDNRKFARQNMETDRSYARALGLDEEDTRRDTRDFGFRQSEAQRDQGNADRSYGLDAQRLSLAGQGAPMGYSRQPDGSLAFDPGGPADPTTAAALAKARGEGTRPRVLPQNSVNALSEAGESVTNTGRVTGSFNKDYAGWGTAALGNAANAVARYTGLGDNDAANWWQDYDRQKNVTRNKLFGSALTAPEKAAFEQADINPGMRPEIIEQNLARQNEASLRAARKLAETYLRQGIDPEVIEGAIGVPLSSLGVSGEGGAGAPAPQQQGGGAFTPGDYEWSPDGGVRPIR